MRCSVTLIFRWIHSHTRFGQPFSILRPKLKGHKTLPAKPNLRNCMTDNPFLNRGKRPKNRNYVRIISDLRPSRFPETMRIEPKIFKYEDVHISTQEYRTQQTYYGNFGGSDKTESSFLLQKNHEQKKSWKNSRTCLPKISKMTLTRISLLLLLNSREWFSGQQMAKLRCQKISEN